VLKSSNKLVRNSAGIWFEQSATKMINGTDWLSACSERMNERMMDSGNEDDALPRGEYDKSNYDEL